MRNFWLIAKNEYRKSIGKRSFLIGTLGIPLLIVIVMGITIAINVGSGNKSALGYVDQSGILAADVSTQLYKTDKSVEILSFPDEASARSALGKKEIQAFYIIPADYLRSRQVSLYYWDDTPSQSVQGDFEDFIRASLAANLPEDLRQRVVKGPEITIRSMDGSREIGSRNILNFLIPFVAGFFFVFTVMGSAGYLLQVVTDEKENRTIEILITSTTPEQLIGGKAFGLMAVTLTQMFIWILTLVVGLVVGMQFVDVLQNVRVPWDFLLVVVLFFFPAFALIAGLMTAIGGSVTEMRQGQQIAGLLNMLFMLPYFLTFLVFTDPSSPLVVAMSLFPTTSFVTITLRWSMTVLPLWQIVASWLILVMSAGFSVWASVRIFRVGMLRYGQSLSLSGAIQAVRSKVQG